MPTQWVNQQVIKLIGLIFMYRRKYFLSTYVASEEELRGTN